MEPRQVPSQKGADPVELRGTPAIGASGCCWLLVNAVISVHDVHGAVSCWSIKKRRLA